MKKIFTSSIFVNFAKFAKFAKFANFATGYFVRVAALLLMLMTLSVGQVWGDCTIHYSNPNAWQTPHCYAWGNGVSMNWNNNDGMTANPNNPGWWDKTMTTCPGNVIFHNGSGSQYDAGTPSGTEMWYTSTGSEAPSISAPAGWSTGAPAKRCVAHNAVMNSHSWNPSADEMMLQDGVYTLTFTNVPADQQVEFKITDGTWNYSWNSVDVEHSNVTTTVPGNVQFTLSTPSDVIIAFNDDTKKITVNTPVAPETKYAVTVSAGAGGSVSPSGAQQIGATGINVTATPSSGYKFQNWSVSGGASVASTTNATTKVTATATGSVTANFVENLNSGWYVAGSFNNWGSTTDELIKDNGSSSVARVTISLSSGNHTFKIHKKDGNKWNGKDNTTIQNNVTVTLNDNSGNNLNLSGIEAGNYEFVYNTSTRDLKVIFPAAAQHKVYYGVHSSGNGTLAAAVNSSAISSGADVAQEATVNFTATPSSGYEVEGWYSNSECTSKIDAAGTSTTYNPTVGAADLTVYVKFVKTQYTLTYDACSSGHGSVVGDVVSGSPQDPNTVVTLTATPEEGYYLRGWYNNADGAHEHLIEYATNASNYQYAVTLDANKTVYAKFEAIPSGIQLDGNLSGRGWDECMPATSSTANSFTWVLDASANSDKEFCIKNSSCENPALIKPVYGYVTFGQTGCTSLVDGGGEWHNFKITNDERALTITATYGSGIYVHVTAGTVTYTGLTAVASPIGSFSANPTISEPSCTSGNTVNVTASSPNTGYEWNRWTSDHGWFGSATSQSTTFRPTASNAVAVANYRAKTYTITLDANGGSASGSAVATYNVGTASNITRPYRAHYIVEGYYAEDGCTHKVMEPNGTLVNYTGYVVDSKWVRDANTTLYTKWTEIPASSDITLHFRSDKGGVVFSASRFNDDGTKIADIPNTSVKETDDCTREQWFTYSVSSTHELRYLYIYASGCQTNGSAFTLTGTGDYYFDCTGKNTVQVDEDAYCPSGNITIYVYSADWNGYSPKLYSQWTAGSGWSAAVEREFEDETCDSNWKKVVYAEEDYVGLKTLQIQLRLYKESSFRTHGSEWTNLTPGAKLYWDITDGCADNEKKPVITKKRPCEAPELYSVSYNLNGGSGVAPTETNKQAGSIFALAAYSGSKDGYTFGGWNDGSRVYATSDSYTMPAKNVTLTAVWYKQAGSASWALVGARFGTWTAAEASYALNMSYRGDASTYYAEIDPYKLGDWFKLTDGEELYSWTLENNDVSKTFAEADRGHKQSIGVNGWGKGSMKISDAPITVGTKTMWVVYDATNHKFWVEDIPTLFDVEVTHTVGEATGSIYALKNTSGAECSQFGASDKFVLSIVPEDGYAPEVMVDGNAVALDHSTIVDNNTLTATTTYTYTGHIEGANHTVTITYRALNAITVYYRIDAPWRTDNTYEPMVQWKTSSANWNGWNYGRRLHKLPGFSNWYYYTFPDATTVLAWQLKNGGVGTDDPELVNHSGQLVSTCYDEKTCFVIESTINEFGQRKPSKAACPEVLLELRVSGGEKIGSEAVLSAKSALKADWTGAHTVRYTYYYKYNDGDWQAITETDGKYKLFVNKVGVFTYKAVVELVDGSDNVIVSDETTTSKEVSQPELILEPSTTAAGQGEEITVRVKVNNIISSEKTFVCFSLLNSLGTTVTPEVVFTNNGDGTYSFTPPSTNGTYTIQAELKVGDDCASAEMVTMSTKQIAVGAMTASFELTPSSPITDNTITMTVTPSSTTGTVYYTYSVKAASNPATRVLASHVTTNTNSSFKIPCEDTYTFTVVVVDDVNSVTLTKTITTGQSAKYMKYCWASNANESWNWQAMTYKGNGIYEYYAAAGANPSKKWNGKNKANISNTQSGGEPATSIIEIGTITDGDIVTYIYDSNTGKLYAYGSGVHRLKSVLEDGRVFYSNEPNNEQQISFYATITGEQYVQTMENGNWVDAAQALDLNLTKDGIYTATMAADGSVSNVEAYTGALYVYALDGGKRSYKGKDAQLVDFRDQSKTYYDHYYMEWSDDAPKGGNFGATMGNDINKCIANILNSYKKPASANLRYEYDSRSNTLSRTMLAGSGDNFLVIYGEGLTTTTGTALTKENPLTFTDNQNWNYAGKIKGVKAVGSNADINGYIRAKYNKEERWVLAADGLESSTDAYQTILGGSTTGGTYDLLLLYDYKTNLLTCGWSPATDIEVEDGLTIDADIIFLRSENDDVSQITLREPDGKIYTDQNVLYAMKFLQKTATTGYYYYMFSLPFDCKVSDVYGFAGSYLSAWGVQRYDGAERAKYGWFEEDGRNFWKWVDYNDTLRAGEGYSLCINRNSQAWYSGGANYLFFPSVENSYALQIPTQSVITYDPLHCTIDMSQLPNGETDPTRDRRAYDSNWRFIGPMSCNNITIDEVIHKNGSSEDWMWHESSTDKYPSGDDRTAGGVANFIYELTFDAQGKITGYVPQPSAGFTFHSFRSYMVQFEGTIDWAQYTEAHPHPSMAPSRSSVADDGVRRPTLMTLALQRGDETIDRTYVQLAEDASTGFDYNCDLTKIETPAKSQLWTVTDGVNYAGNVLPLTVDTVPLTLHVASGDYYTIKLQQYCAEYNPVLIDTYTQSVTSLNEDEYTFRADAANYAERFLLVLAYRAPQQPNTPTDVPIVNSGDLPDVHKLLINGMFYVLRAGHLYDGMGRLVY